MRDRLADGLMLDADEVEHTVTLDLNAASVPDRQAPGHVCHDCLQRTMQTRVHYWKDEGDVWLCPECEARYNPEQLDDSVGDVPLSILV